MNKPMIFTIAIVAAIVVLGGYFIVFNKQPANNNAESQRMEDVVLQKVINMPELDVYFHPEVSGRVPLRILKNRVIQNEYSLTKFSQPVVFVGDEAKANKTPFIEFTRLEVMGNSAVVEFGYDIEGLSGKVNLQLNNGQWEITAKDFSER